MIGFLREVTRLGRLPVAAAQALTPSSTGPPASRRGRAPAGCASDPRLLLLAAYSMVTGLATEVEVPAFGEPTLASLGGAGQLRTCCAAARRPEPGPGAGCAVTSRS